MGYTIFFLLGIPLWLIASAKVFRSPGERPVRKIAWAAGAFFAPLAIFGLASLVHVMIQHQWGETAAWVRGLGYFLIAVNLFAFFSPFAVSFLYESLYGTSHRQTSRI